MKSLLHEETSRTYRKWTRSGTGVETALFIGVQAVMLVCIVLMAAELFVTA